MYASWRTIPFLKNAQNTTDDQIKEESSRWWRRIVGIPSKQQQLEENLLSITRLGIAKIPIPELSKNLSVKKRKEILFSKSCELIEELNKIMGGYSGQLETDVSVAMRKVDLEGKSNIENSHSEKLTQANPILESAKNRLNEHTKMRLEQNVEIQTLLTKDKKPTKRRHNLFQTSIPKALNLAIEQLALHCTLNNLQSGLIPPLWSLLDGPNFNPTFARQPLYENFASC